MSTRRSIAWLAAVFAACTFLSWQGRDEPRLVPEVRAAPTSSLEPPSPGVAPESTLPSSVKTASARPGSTPVPPAATTAITSSLGRKLLEVTNVRAYVLDALKHPEKGGAFYAILALKQCKPLELYRMSGESAIQRIVETESTISSERLAAITAPTTLCREFSLGEVDALKEQAEELGLSGADPMLKLVMSQRDTVPTDERNAALETIAKSRNMALASEVGAPFLMLRNASTPAEGSIFLTTRFDGQTYGRYDAALLQVAAELATCVEGEYCKVDEFRLSHCWLTGVCIADREQFMRSWLFREDPDRFERVLAFSNRMRAALLRGDTSMFR